MEFIKSLLRPLYRKYKSWVGESPSTRDRALIAYQVKKHGLINFIFNKTYNDGFFEDHVPFLPAYTTVANTIYETFKPLSVLDIGCGNGFLIQCLNSKGVTVSGVDGAAEILSFIDPSIKGKVMIADLSQRHDFGKFELVISTEVAEHIPKKHAVTFIKNLTQSAQNNILFSAAQPGQWGDGHINCQPKTFWIDLMEKEGWEFQEGKTNNLTGSLYADNQIMKFLPWLANNLMVFTPIRTSV